MRRVERLRKEEDGAVAVLVGIAIVALLGFGAIVIDVGSLYAERRQLQNGADAGALAVAWDCLNGDCSGYQSITQTLADANANDGAAFAEDVCGTGPGLPACTDPPSTPGVGYARVRTATGTDAGTDLITPFLAQVLNAANTGTTVRAEAVAAWGSIGGIYDMFPLSFCWDQWLQLTDSGNHLAPPPYNVYYHTPSTPIDCPTTDDTYSGGFGWLNINDPALEMDLSSCTATATISDWEPGRPGVGLPNTAQWQTCVNKLRAKILEMNANPDAEPLLVPIFNNWRASGANGELFIEGMGAFRPTGYHLGGGQFYPSNSVCGSPSDRCIRGYFMEWVVPDGIIGGGDYGVMTVQMTH